MLIVKISSLYTFTTSRFLKARLSINKKRTFALYGQQVTFPGGVFLPLERIMAPLVEYPSPLSSPYLSPSHPQHLLTDTLVFPIRLVTFVVDRLAYIKTCLLKTIVSLLIVLATS